MYGPVIFDLDGTLLNTIADLAAAGNFALERMGFPAHTIEEYKYFVGNGIPKLIERMCPPDSTEKILNTAHEYFAEYYEKHKCDFTRPYGGIPELLTELKAEGVTAVCNTNKDHVFAKALLERFYGDCIAEVAGAGLGYKTKPCPDAANYLAEKYREDGLKPLYIGDSAVDMQTARAAGIDACGVLWGFRTREELENESPAHIVQTPAQLRDIIFG